MLSLLSALLGFLLNFLPTLLKYYQGKDDNRHELAMMRLQIEAARSAELYKQDSLEHGLTETYIPPQPTQNYGVQLLDACDKYSATTWGRFLISPVFYIFSLLDAFSGLVRPIVTIGLIVLYAYVKATNPLTWGENDYAVVTLILSFWFGSRVYRQSYGGSTQDSKKN
jgi:hypothetical protein